MLQRVLHFKYGNTNAADINKVGAMTQPVKMDGSLGEGGGQVLRSSLSLSMITGRPFQMRNVRARRQKPGLRLQHLTAVQAAATICQASCTGDSVGSGEVCFTPGEVRPGSYRFSVGSAGSACLVLQTVLPALLTAGGPSTVTIEGGTHNPMAPPFDYIAEAFVPLLERMGARVELRLQQYGFYPAGGGRLTVSVVPCPRLEPLELLQRGAPGARGARAIVANLPAHIARRELKVVQQKLGWSDRELTVQQVKGPGPGNVLVVSLAFEQVTELFCGFGKRGVPAEAVAARVMAEVRRYQQATAPVGRHLADQLLLPLALAGRGVFRTMPLTQHTRTNMEVIRQFIDVRMQSRELEDGSVEVQIG